MSIQDDALLYDMLLEARRVRRFVDGLDRAEFDHDEVRRYAVLHATTRLGLAAAGVSDARRKAHPELPWDRLIGMRDHLVERHGEVDRDIVWVAATRDIPALVPVLEGVIPDPDVDEETKETTE